MLEKTKEVLKSEELLRFYKSGDRAMWADNFIEDREFRLGEQFDEEVKEYYESKGLMAASINETLPATDQIIADLTSNNPRFDAIAVENSDVKVASYVSRLFDWIFYISKGQTKIERNTKDFCEGGVGCLFTYPDYNADNGKGELKVVDVDPLDVYIDPSTKEPDSSDAGNILISPILSEDKINTTWDVDLTDAEDERIDEYSRQRAETQGQIIFASKLSNVKYYRIIERFTKIKVKRYHVYDPTSGYENIFEEEEKFLEWAATPAIIIVELSGETYITDELEVEKYLEIYRTIGDTFHLVQDQFGNNQLMPGVEDNSPYTIPNSTTQIKVTTKSQFIEEKIILFDVPKVDRIQRVFSIGGKQIVDEVLPITNYPIVTSMLHHNRNPYATGDVRLIKPLQEQLNILDSRIQSYLRIITSLKGFVPEGTTAAKLGKAGEQMGMELFEYNPEDGGVPIFPQYPVLPAGIMAQRENIIRQIQRIIGAYSFQDGEAISAPRTASGTAQIDEFMRRRSAYKKRKLEASLEQLAKVMAEYIPYVYTERKIIRLVLPNHKTPQETIINDKVQDGNDIKLINNVVNVKFDVRIISGSTLPNNRVQERAEILEAYQLGMIKNPKWWIMKSDFDDIDEILKEEDLIGQLQNTVQQLQEEVKNLSGQLQTKSREVIQANEKVDIQKTKSVLKDYENKIESKVELTSQRLGDLVKENKGAKNE